MGCFFIVPYEVYIYTWGVGGGEAMLYYAKNINNKVVIFSYAV